MTENKRGSKPSRQIWRNSIKIQNQLGGSERGLSDRRAKRAGGKIQIPGPNPYKTLRFPQIRRAKRAGKIRTSGAPESNLVSGARIETAKCRDPRKFNQNPKSTGRIGARIENAIPISRFRIHSFIS